MRSMVSRKYWPSIRFVRAFGMALILSLGSAGCISKAQPIPHGGGASLRVLLDVGDRVRVLTKHGERRTFKITAIDHRGLSGKKLYIPYSDIASVERIEWNDRANAAVVAGAALIIYLLHDVNSAFGGLEDFPLQ